MSRRADQLDPAGTGARTETTTEWSRFGVAASELLSPSARAARLRDSPFGQAFTEHMVTIRWTADRGWHHASLRPYGSLPLDPAMVGLHYGQVVFEGLKAYRSPDGQTSVFRMADHARRLQRSARRFKMPELPESLFTESIQELVRIDRAWVPAAEGRSLYLRPILYAEEPHLGLRPATTYRYLLMAFVTENFFGAAEDGVSVWVTDTYTRAVIGGTGEAKCAGNYASGYLAQQEAADHECQQVLYLDATERRWVEEMGGMNVFVVRGSGAAAEIVTPPLTGTILPGVTRDSLLTLARDAGLRATERPLALEDWRDGAARGEITEAFACGTAAGVTRIRRVVTADGAWNAGSAAGAPVTGRLRAALTAAQRGDGPDPRGWRHPVR
ncbi:MULTISPECIES: branched-chain amino acid aminotransferase [unclassified Micromonospora]|uniref:branched-chain amino acid aminotransferase n=1 Tax=unclassified Micromonospora TaxID=2617518 RepID=UPI00332C0A0A